MGQYFTDRLQEVFHMIFTSYDSKQAQEGLRRLELIVNNQSIDNPTTHHGLRRDVTTYTDPSGSTENAETSENAEAAGAAEIDQELSALLKNSKNREIGDAYALLARVYAGPHFTWEESGFPEDNMRTYQCLHDSIRRHSPIGTLQTLRIAGSITPTVKRDMQLSFDNAFRIVYDYAQQGDAYCQYIIGNVFFWRDDQRISAARALLEPTDTKWSDRLQRIFHSRNIQDGIAALQGTVTDKTLHIKAVESAKFWFNKSLDNNLAMFQGNLRNIYIDESDHDNARRVARTAAELGNPTMMLYTGLDCHENGRYEDAFTWFTKGAALGQPECITELADYYYHFYDIQNLRATIPYDPIKAIGLYRKAAIKNFNDAGYAALQAAFGYIFHIGHLPLDWGLIADLTHTAATKDRFVFALPYIAYIRLHGLGVSQNTRFAVQSLLRVLEEETRALEKEDRVLFYDITRALTRVALGYAYEKGYVTGTPDLDMAVHYYESSHQYILSHKANCDEEMQDFPVDDEAADRLQAFEEIDGHWHYKEGYTESTSPARPAPAAWPQFGARLAIDMDDYPWETTLYDWNTIDTALQKHQRMMLSFYNHFLSIPNTLRNLNKLEAQPLPNNKYQVRLHGYTETEGQEITYKAALDIESVRTLLHTIYNNRTIAALSDEWALESEKPQPTWHYVLDVDQETFPLEEYDDAGAMIQTALQGLNDNQYKKINIRTHDFIGPSYFIFRDNSAHPFRVQLYLKESVRHHIDENGEQQNTPGNAYLFEHYFDNEISLNYWIQKTINTLEIPDLDQWKQLRVPKDLQ